MAISLASTFISRLRAPSRNSILDRLKATSGLLVFLFTICAESRVFDFKNESFATYLKGNYQSSVPGIDPFAKSSGTNFQQEDRFRATWGYEFGLVITRAVLSLKVGIEVIQPPELKGVRGTHKIQGYQAYTFDSAVSGFTLKGGFEGHLYSGKTSRWSLVAEGGLATLKVQNSYKFNGLGQAEFNLANFREELNGTAVMLGGGLQFENLISDTTTFFIDGGYRNLSVPTLTHAVATTTFQGPVTQGTVATNDDGTKRTLNLSGPYLGFGIRFWL